MKENLYTYIYRGAMWVMAFSCVMMLFMESKVPFGISASWNPDTFGSSLVFTIPTATAKIGEAVAGRTEVEGEVSVYAVEEIIRREGVLYYRLSNPEIMELSTIMPANDFGRAVLAQVPLLGFLAQSLKNTLGVMALIGLPFLMFSINFLVFGTREVLLAISVFENNTKSKKVRRVQKEKVEESEASYHHEENVREVGNEYVTVLKPYNFQQRYSH